MPVILPRAKEKLWLWANLIKRPGFKTKNTEVLKTPEYLDLTE
jgi:hypothetical protein